MKTKEERQNIRQGKGMRGVGMRGNGEKAKDFSGAMGKLVRYAKRYKKYIFIAIVCGVLGAILTLMGPNNISKLTSEITKGIASSAVISEMNNRGVDVQALLSSGNEEMLQQMLKNAPKGTEISIEDLKNPGLDMKKIWSIGIFLIVIYALSYVLSVMQGVIMSTCMQKTAKRLRTDISKKINRLPMGYFSKVSKGDVLSRVTNDVDTIGMSTTQAMGTLVSSTTLLLGSLIMMSITNVILTITAILSTLIGFVFMMIVMKKSQKYFSRQQKNLGKMNGHIEEMYSGHIVVKAYNGEENAEKVFDEVNEKLKQSSFKAQAMSGMMMPMMGFVGNLGYVSVCIVGALLALNNYIDFGVIVAFMIYIRLFTQPLSHIAQAMQQMQSGAAAGERVFEFLEEEEMADEGEKPELLPHVKGLVEFKHVRFGYEDDKIIIKDFSAVAHPGQKIAIVGPTGAGKTTLVNLLMRFYEIQSGEILIDGVSIKSMSREEVHEQFCMVLQDTWLFEGSMRENLVYAAENVTQEKLDTACKAVGLSKFIRTLPHGYDSMLNDSLTLSQGQKQQITIARAMIADKPMLILDEATSSVDTRTEQLIQNAMDELMTNRTSFVIAHRLSTIKNADLILVLKDGDIIEMGNHDELIEKNGFYAELYNAQFETDDE